MSEVTGHMKKEERGNGITFSFLAAVTFLNYSVTACLTSQFCFYSSYFCFPLVLCHFPINAHDS